MEKVDFEELRRKLADDALAGKHKGDSGPRAALEIDKMERELKGDFRDIHQRLADRAKGGKGPDPERK